LASYTDEGPLILRQAKELGLHVQFLTTRAILSDQFFAAVNDSTEGVLVVDAPRYPDRVATGATSSFATRYKEVAGTEVQPQHSYVARAFDAFEIIGGIARQCVMVTGECIRYGLVAMKSYEGTGGQVLYASAGDNVPNLFYTEWKITPWYPIDNKKIPPRKTRRYFRKVDAVSTLRSQPATPLVGDGCWHRVVDQSRF